MTADARGIGETIQAAPCSLMAFIGKIFYNLACVSGCVFICFFIRYLSVYIF